MTRWLEIVEHDYLSTYVAGGGSAVKFVITADAEYRAKLGRSLRTLADRYGFQSFSLDARATKLHFVQMLFHELSRQLDWGNVATEYMMHCFHSAGVAVTRSSFPVELTRLESSHSDLGGGLVDRIQSFLRTDLVDDHAMSHEFKTAFLNVCLGQVNRANVPISRFGPAIVRWFRGEIQHISELKEARIFQKVARNNARHLLSSLAHLIRKIGRRGTFINLDISRYLESNRFADRVSGNYYTPAATLDLYELLRQLVDDQGTIEGLFLVVHATPALLSDSFRSLNRYQALKMRIVDDIRVWSKQNLFAPMVRL